LPSPLLSPLPARRSPLRGFGVGLVAVGLGRRSTLLAFLLGRNLGLLLRLRPAGLLLGAFARVLGGLGFVAAEYEAAYGPGGAGENPGAVAAIRGR
jgi:hypothetical protein